MLEDVNLGTGDAAAVDGLDPQCGVQVEGGGRIVQDGRFDAGVQKGSEKHVATDTGEAVEVGDTHEVILSQYRQVRVLCRQG